MKRVAFKARTRQAGTVAVEFSLVAIIFFTVVFGTLELARWEYLLNTLQEVTRRAAAAAANADFSDAALERVRADAVFRDSLGPLALGEPVTAENVIIDYLSVLNTDWDLKHVSTRPACPARSQLNCMTDPHADNCIRFVRARVCDSMDAAGNCTPLAYQMVFPFFDLSGVNVPTSETIVPAGSLGATAGSIVDDTCPDGTVEETCRRDGRWASQSDSAILVMPSDESRGIRSRHALSPGTPSCPGWLQG